MGLASSVLSGIRRKGLVPTLEYGLTRHFWSGGGGTWAGINVTAENALHVAAYFAGVRVIVEDIAKLPFIVYSQTRDGQRERATDSDMWRLIHDRPNDAMSSQQFREYLTACAINRGNGYALKARVGRGPVRELWPLHPDRVWLERQGDWSILYHVTDDDGTERTHTSETVFHLPGLSLGGVGGVSVIEYARQNLGNMMGATRQAGTFFGNGMRPSGILSPKGKMTAAAKEAIKAELLEKASGNNTNALLIFDEDMSYAPVSVNARDSQFLESRAFEVLEICRWLRLPPHKIADLSRATFSNIEQMAMEYVTDTLMPWGARWEAAINQQVLADRSLMAELLYDGLLRGTTAERYGAYAQAVGGPAPWMSRNEIRRRENLPPLPGLDEVLVPLNMSGAEGGSNGSQTA